MSDDREILVREIPIEMAAGGDGRTIDARIVPYGVQATVADAPTYEPYTEEFVPGAFERQTRAADRVKVWLNFEHDQGLRGIVGHGIALEERADGLYGSFRVHPGSDGDKALQMIRERILTGMSVEFASLKSRVVGGVVQRLRAHVEKASLVMSGKEAYPGAAVLAVREAPDESDDPKPPEPEPERNTEIDELLERVGYEPIKSRVVTRKAWDGATSKYEDADAYCSACLIDTNPAGEDKTQARCMLPVYEPNGELNENALPAAAGRLNQVGASSADKAAAARKLMRLYGLAGMEMPPAVKMMASK